MERSVIFLGGSAGADGIIFSGHFNFEKGCNVELASFEK